MYEYCNVKKSLMSNYWQIKLIWMSEFQLNSENQLTFNQLNYIFGITYLSLINAT